jgi:hypothetical protein
VAIDCRMFADPGARARHRGVNHLGFHTSNVVSIVNDVRFEAFLRDAARRIYRVVNQPRQVRSAYIACYCLSGRHRSVTMGVVLAECVDRDMTLNWTTAGIEHTSQAHPAGWAGTCGHCQECIHDPAGAREAAFQRAFSIWQQVVQELVPHGPAPAAEPRA